MNAAILAFLWWMKSSGSALCRKKNGNPGQRSWMSLLFRRHLFPRTLHMSLTGVRDMVAMTQPPANRHAIQTYVTEYDDTIVKDAILHEKARGGQTYFIYNRIESIRAMEAHLRDILPSDVTIAVAYGQMDGRTLEKSWWISSRRNMMFFFVPRLLKMVWTSLTQTRCSFMMRISWDCLKSIRCGDA